MRHRVEHIEGRTLIVGVALLTLSVYVSGFNPIVSVLVILISFGVFAFSVRVKQFLLCALAVAPFALISFLTAPLNYAFRVSLAMFSILFAGSLPFNLTTSEFCYALSYFIPERFAFQIALAIRMFSVLKRDLKHCFEAAKLEVKGLSVYKNALKAFVSVSVLRSVAVAETLYCRNYSGKIFKDFKKVNIKSLVFLTLCLFVFILSLLILVNFIK